MLIRSALAFLLAGLPHVSGQVIAITAGTLIDPANGSETKNQTILVEAGKIKEVGAELRIPGDAIRIDLSREAVLPGLIDAHTHLLATVDPLPLIALRCSSCGRRQSVNFTFIPRSWFARLRKVALL